MGFREIYSAKAKRRKDIRAAVNAVRKEARKVSREQAREMLIAELRRHDVDPLPADAAKHRFGILDGADGELFREYVEEGARPGNPVVAEGIREVSDDRRWSLELFRPA